MRKCIRKVIVASLFLAFPAILLSTCGGGGGGGGESNPGTLTGLSINGPSSVTEYGTAAYTATASWSDNTTTSVESAWSIDSQAAAINPGGVLSCSQIDGDQAVTITATFSSGGITETASMSVTLLNVAAIPFTPDMLSGKVFYKEVSLSGGTTESRLFRFDAGSSFEQTSLLPIGAVARVSGTWSIDASGRLVLAVPGSASLTLTLLGDGPTGMEVAVDEGTGTPSREFVEKTVPVDPSKLPGTYQQSPEGYTWVFNPNGTGTCSIFGGLSFTWSEDSGVLKMPSGTGYSAWFYVRAGTQSSETSYTLLQVAFTEYGPGGVFYTYYGGKDLTRQ